MSFLKNKTAIITGAGRPQRLPPAQQRAQPLLRGCGTGGQTGPHEHPGEEEHPVAEGVEPGKRHVPGTDGDGVGALQRLEGPGHPARRLL